jgi:hypothetical protein
MPGGSRDACAFAKLMARQIAIIFDGLHQTADSRFSCGLKCYCSPPEIFRTVKGRYIRSLPFFYSIIEAKLRMLDLNFAKVLQFADLR